MKPHGVWPLKSFQYRDSGGKAHSYPTRGTSGTPPSTAGEMAIQFHLHNCVNTTPVQPIVEIFDAGSLSRIAAVAAYLHNCFHYDHHEAHGVRRRHTLR